MLEPLYKTDARIGTDNWSGLANATIDADIEAIKSFAPGSAIRAQMIDKVVKEIIVEQAAAFYTIGVGEYIAWNQNLLIDGTEQLVNPRRDKYFYPIDFSLTNRSDFESLEVTKFLDLIFGFQSTLILSIFGLMSIALIFDYFKKLQTR